MLVVADKPIAERLVGLHRRDGYRAAMVEWIALLERLNQWYEVALQRMAIDEPALALDALERCVAERNDHVPFVLQYPSFRPLRGEPRYERLVRDLKLEDGNIRGSTTSYARQR